MFTSATGLRDPELTLLPKPATVERCPACRDDGRARAHTDSVLFNVAESASSAAPFLAVVLSFISGVFISASILPNWPLSSGRCSRCITSRMDFSAHSPAPRPDWTPATWRSRRWGLGALLSPYDAFTGSHRERATELHRLRPKSTGQTRTWATRRSAPRRISPAQIRTSTRTTSVAIKWIAWLDRAPRPGIYGLPGRRSSKRGRPSSRMSSQGAA